MDIGFALHPTLARHLNYYYDSPPRLPSLFQPELLDLGLDQGHVLWLVHAVRAVVHHDDLDLVTVLNHLELLQVLHELSKTGAANESQRRPERPANRSAGQRDGEEGGEGGKRDSPHCAAAGRT